MPQEDFDALVKIRLASRPVPARVERMDGGSFRLLFSEPQRAVAPGQSAVLYRDGVIAGGGIITRPLYAKEL